MSKNKGIPLMAYLKVAGMTLVISLLGSLKYNLPAFRPTKNFDPVRFWLMAGIDFVVLFIPALLLAYFYYRMKNKAPLSDRDEK